MSIITIRESVPLLDTPLLSKPCASLMAVGVHGPARSERHRVDNHWCLHLYTYSATISIDGCSYPIKPGCAGILPPSAETVYSFPHRAIHACAHFLFEAEGDQKPIKIPLLQDLGPRFPSLYKQLEEAISTFRSNPIQAEVRLWDILWQLAKPVQQSDLTQRAHHPAVVRAIEVIELRLAEPISVPEIAESVALSHNQLTRLFRASLDRTVVGYIQERRAARAQHLLLNTHLPINVIARQVGVDDTRLFNKLTHRYLGSSPSEVRLKQKDIVTRSSENV